MPTFVITVDTAGAVQNINRLQTGVNQLSTSFERADGTIRMFEKGVTSFRRAVLGVQAIIGGFGVAEMIKDLIKVNVSFERVRLSLIAGHNSLEAAAADFEYVRKAAIRLGIPLANVGMEYSKLNAAAKGTALQGEPVRKIFESVSKASIAMGLDVSTTQRVFMALTQMLSKGRVQAEEARQQFGEHLPGGFKALAVAAGYDAVKGLGKFQKALSQGKVDAIDMMTNLPTVLDEMFGKAFEAALTSPQQAINRFKNTFDNLLYDLGQKGGFMREFVQLLIDLSKVMSSDQGMAQIERLSVGLGNLMAVVRKATIFLAQHVQVVAGLFTGAAFSAAILGIKGLVSWLIRLAGVSEGATLLGNLANPCILIAADIGAAAAGLVMFNDRIVKLHGFSANALDWLTTGFQLIGERVHDAGLALENWLEKLPVLGSVIRTLADDFRDFIAQVQSFGAGINPGVAFNSLKENFRNLLQPVYDWLDALIPAVSTTAHKVSEIWVKNVRAGLDEILGLFGSSLSTLPQQLSKLFGQSFHSLVDFARAAVEQTIRVFFFLVESGSIVFKLLADIISNLMIALNPVIESLYETISRVADDAKANLAPDDTAMSAWQIFVNLISTAYDIVAEVITVGAALFALAANIAAPLIDAVRAVLTGIGDVAVGISRLWHGMDSGVKESSKNMQKSATDQIPVWAKVIDAIIGFFLDIIGLIGVVIEWVGVLIATLGELGGRVAKAFTGAFEAQDAFKHFDMAGVHKATEKIAAAFSEPFADSVKRATHSAIEDTKKFFSEEATKKRYSTFSDSMQTGQNVLDGFGRGKEAFKGAWDRFSDQMAKATQNPEAYRAAGEANGSSYVDGFMDEWGNRASDLTSKKLFQKLALEDERKRIQAVNDAAYQQENDSIDRSIRPDLAGNKTGHRKSPAERAAEQIADLRAQMRMDDLLSSQISTNPKFDPMAIKATEDAQAAIKRSGFDVSYGEALGSKGIVHTLASVAFQASLARQQMDRLAATEKYIANNSQAITAFEEQAQMAKDLTISTSALNDQLVAEKALREKGWTLTVQQATAVDQFGRALNPAADALVKTTIAQEQANRATSAAIEIHKQLREGMQTSSEFDAVTVDIASSSAAMERLTAQTTAEHAVMEKFHDDVFDSTRLLDPMTKALYDQAEAFSLAGGSAEKYASVLNNINDQYLRNHLTPGQYTRQQILDQSALQQQIVTARRNGAVNDYAAGVMSNYHGNMSDDKLQELQAKSQLAVMTYDQAMAMIKDNAAQALLENSDSFTDQLLAGIHRWGKEAGDVAGQMKDAFDHAFSGMVDMLTNFVMTGKLNFADFARSVIADITRMIIKWLVWMAIKTAAEFAGLPVPFADGGIMSNRGSIPLTKYAGGGVAKRPQMALFGEGSRPEAYVPLPDGRTIPVTLMGDGLGSAGAGSSALMASISAGAQMGVQRGLQGYDGGSNGSKTIDINVNLSGTLAPAPSGDAATNAKFADAMSKRLAAELRGTVIEVVQNEMRPGGTFNPMGSNKPRF